MKKDTMAQSVESSPFMFFTKRVIGAAKDPYLIRWILVQTPWFSIYVHKMCRSDYERALHDHPWSFVSFVLKPYSEITAFGYKKELRLDHHIGSILYRPARWRHRVIIENPLKPAWTIVFTGPRQRPWGFWPNGIFCHWKKFNQESGICESAPLSGRTGLD